MAQTYTRQSSFSDGDTITAALFNNEYNQLVNAFSYSSSDASSTGHRHDGTAGQGGNIHTIGDLDFLNKIVVDSTNNRWGFYVEVSAVAVEQIRIQDGAIVPVTDDDIDLGTSSLEFKNIYIDGTAKVDTLTVDENATIAGTLGVTGATTLSSTLGVTGAATLSSTLAVTGTSTLTGNVTTTNDLSVGGNLTVTGNATIAGNLTFGDAATDTVAFSADVASNLLPSADNTYDLGASGSEWKDLYIDGTANIDSLVADTADINAGTIDNTAIGGTTASTGAFTTLSASGATTLSTTLGVTGATTLSSTLGVTGESTLASAIISDLTSGRVVLAGTSGAVEDSGNLTFDGTTLAVTGAATVSTDLTVSGNTTLGNAATDTVTVTADIASNLIPSVDDTYDLGASGSEWKDIYIDGTAYLDAINFNGTAITSTAAELNLLDGVTATTAELNYLDVTTLGTVEASKAVTADANADVKFGDNAKAVFGADSDLQIYHGGNHSFISEQGTGNLKILADSLVMKNAADTQNYITGTSGGAATLYHAGSEKLATTATGIDVTGSVIADGLTVDGTEAVLFDIDKTITTPHSDYNIAFINSDDDEFVFRIDAKPAGSLGSGHIKLFSESANRGAFIFATENGSSGVVPDRLKIDYNGNISFYEDTGTTAKLFWDASAERLGIGNSSPATALDVTGTVTADGLTVDGDVFVSTSSSTTDGTDGAFVDIKNTDTTTSVVSGVRFLNGTTTAFKGAVFFEDLAGDGRGDVVIASNDVASGSAAVGLADQRLRISRSGDISFYEDTGTTAKLFWDASAESLGIGSASPVGRLDVSGGADGTIGSITLAQGNTTSKVAKIYGTSVNTNEKGIRFNTFHYGDIDAVAITSDGNVGIGTSSPEVSLQVLTASNTIARITAGTSSIAGLDFGDADDTDIGRIRYNNSDNSMAFTVNAAERMRILSGGNITIDTVDAYFYSNASSGGTTIDAGFKLESSTQALEFWTADAERMRVDSSGNVGIGTSAIDGTLVLAAGTSGSASTGGYLGFTTGTNASKVRGAGIEAFSLTTGNDHGLRFFTNASTAAPSEAMRITSAGTVGIGVVPETWLSTYTALQIGASGVLTGISSGNANVMLMSNAYLGTDGNYKYIATNVATRYAQSAGVHYWYTAASGTADTNVTFSQNMTLDASGNLLVGKTSADTYNNTNGIELQASGLLTATRAGIAQILNREDSDGDIAVFRKDGTTVGSIGSNSGNMYITSVDVGLLFNSGANQILPAASTDISDATKDLGSSGARFKDLYLSGTGYIGTSIGIGTTSPNTLVHLSDAGPVLAIGSTSASDPRIDFYDQSATTIAASLFFDQDADTLKILRTASGSATDGILIDSSGHAIIPTGVTLGTSGTYNAANTLDDYEEGSWTPVFKGSTTAGTYTYTTQAGRYVKVGNLVTVWCTLTDITASSAGTGDIVVGGLPFTIANLSTYERAPNGGTRIRQVATGFTAQPNAFGGQNSTDVYFLIPNGTSDIGVSITTYYASNMDIGFTLTYEAA